MLRPGQFPLESWYVSACRPPKKGDTCGFALRRDATGNPKGVDVHPSLISMCATGNVGWTVFEVSVFILGGDTVGM